MKYKFNQKYNIMERNAIYTFMHDWNGDTFMAAKEKQVPHDRHLGSYRDNAHNVALKFSKRLEDCLDGMRVGDTLTIEVTLKHV